MEAIICPRCNSSETVKSGLIKGEQRYKCGHCMYHFVPGKDKKDDTTSVIRTIQLAMEGLSYREIGKILDVTHTTVGNRLKGINLPKFPASKLKFQEFESLEEVWQEIKTNESDTGQENKKGFIVLPTGGKYILFQW